MRSSAGAASVGLPRRGGFAMNWSRVSTRLVRGCQRRAAGWFGRRPFVMPRGPAIISFTFDDFPRSALINGGAILEHYGIAGTYYVSLGLSRQITPCGEMFDVDELPCLVDLGHELGCHTYSHCPAWNTTPEVFEREVLRNADQLRRRLPSGGFRTLSYPISHPRPGTKDRLSRYFALCRGGGQTMNEGTIDLNYVSAFFLEQSEHNPTAVMEVIKRNHAAGGWLIFATHDVSQSPTRYGCTTAFFQTVVRSAVDSGAEILSVSKAWDRLVTRAGARPTAGTSASPASSDPCHRI
jgi:peptidoglycan/xylan/chitin deacetylase (PgdA/CDA1 family)